MRHGFVLEKTLILKADERGGAAAKPFKTTRVIKVSERRKAVDLAHQYEDSPLELSLLIHNPVEGGYAAGFAGGGGAGAGVAFTAGACV